jgi:hypothetical protein
MTGGADPGAGSASRPVFTEDPYFYAGLQRFFNIFN